MIAALTSLAPEAMRQWLRLRDGKCPFPGCCNQSLDNEADHILAWAKGGTTGVSNLGLRWAKRAWRGCSTPTLEPDRLRRADGRDCC
ncbi:hypothetical protein QF031_001636 [Pseudarthrobacter defluvii]|nr:hypothetical protein [Pseudarthrobacter defluvii]